MVDSSISILTFSIPFKAVPYCYQYPHDQALVHSLGTGPHLGVVGRFVRPEECLSIHSGAPAPGYGGALDHKSNVPRSLRQGHPIAGEVYSRLKGEINFGVLKYKASILRRSKVDEIQDF